MIYRVLFILAVLFVITDGCHDNGTSASARSAEEVRIEREVRQRVEVAEKESGLKARRDQLHTIRVTGFIILTAGAVTALMWRSRPLSPVNPVSGAAIQTSQPVQWNNPGNQPQRSSIWGRRRVARTGRVIDMTGLKTPAGSPAPRPPPVSLPPPDPVSPSDSQPPNQGRDRYADHRNRERQNRESRDNNPPHRHENPRHP